METDLHAPTTNERLMRRASYASVAVASLLVAGKLYAWWQTDSLAMLSSFIDSVFDVGMSVVNLIALRYALKPADDDHRFGHTAIEDITSLAQAAFIAAGMVLILLQSVARLGHPTPLANESIGLIITGIALVLSVGLVAYQNYVTARVSSLIVASDRMHYIGDILFNIGVLIAFGLSAYGHIEAADPLIAILIAGVVLYNIRPVAVRAYNNLMDTEMPDTEKAIIVGHVKAISEIRGYHHLKTRYSGIKPFIQMHIDMDASLNFRDAHDITERLEQALLNAFPGAEVIIHPDPVE